MRSQFAGIDRDELNDSRSVSASPLLGESSRTAAASLPLAFFLYSARRHHHVFLSLSLSSQGSAARARSWSGKKTGRNDSPYVYVRTLHVASVLTRIYICSGLLPTAPLRSTTPRGEPNFFPRPFSPRLSALPRVSFEYVDTEYGGCAPAFRGLREGHDGW